MRRIVNILVFLVAIGTIVGTTGCVTTSKGPPPPTFTEASERAAKIEEDLNRIHVAIETDIGNLRAASAAFFDADSNLYREPFPLDLFRHAGMACLNTPLEPRGDVLPIYMEAADEAGVTCPVAPVGPLLDQLAEDVPSRQPDALKRLGLLDEWRRTRGRMQDRLKQLPRILDNAREWAASQRAGVRQTELEIQRRKNEYSLDRYEASLKAVEAQRERLTQLEAKVDELEEAIPAWTRAVGAEIDYVYSRLSLLGPT